jgi:hypothetical protein
MYGGNKKYTPLCFVEDFKGDPVVDVRIRQNG